MVTYRALSNWPGYRFGTDSSAWTCRCPSGRARPDRWRPLRVVPSAEGIAKVRLCCNGRRAHRSLASLLLEAFVGPCPPGYRVFHRDGDHANLRLDNLVWATPAEVAAARLARGSALMGSQLPQAKLDEPLVGAILYRLTTGEEPQALADAFQVSKWTIHRINRREMWKHVTASPAC